jgi:excisionase family DNA binding protein
MENVKMNPANFEKMLDAAAVAYRPEQVAEIINVGRTKVFEMIASGELRARKLGRATLITSDDLRDCLSRLPLAGNSNIAA